MLHKFPSGSTFALPWEAFKPKHLHSHVQWFINSALFYPERSITYVSISRCARAAFYCTYNHLPLIQIPSWSFGKRSLDLNNLHLFLIWYKTYGLALFISSKPVFPLLDPAVRKKTNPRYKPLHLRMLHTHTPQVICATALSNISHKL